MEVTGHYYKLPYACTTAFLIVVNILINAVALRHRGGVIRVLCTFVLKLFLYKWLLR
jgi:hypothetical protein